MKRESSQYQARNKSIIITCSWFHFISATKTKPLTGSSSSQRTRSRSAFFSRIFSTHCNTTQPQDNRNSIGKVLLCGKRILTLVREQKHTRFRVRIFGTSASYFEGAEIKAGVHSPHCSRYIQRLYTAAIYSGYIQRLKGIHQILNPRWTPMNLLGFGFAFLNLVYAPHNGAAVVFF